MTHASSPCRTGSTACGWTPGSRACWACRAPRSRRWPRRAASPSTGGRRQVGPAGGRQLARGRAARAGAAGGHRRARRGRRRAHDPARGRRSRGGRQARRRRCAPQPGLDGPAVLGGLAALGVRVATSGAAERQGIVHRLDVGTTGVMVVAKSEHAYSVLNGYSRSAPSRSATTPSCRGTPTRRAAPSTPPSTGTRSTTTSGPSSPAAGKRHPLRHDRGVPAASLLDVRLETGRTHQIRVHMAALRHPCVGDIAYGADPVLAKGLGWSGSGCTPASWASSTRPRPAGRVAPAVSCSTWHGRWTCCRTEGRAGPGQTIGGAAHLRQPACGLREREVRHPLAAQQELHSGAEGCPGQPGGRPVDGPAHDRTEHLREPGPRQRLVVRDVVGADSCGRHGRRDQRRRGILVHDGSHTSDW